MRQIVLDTETTGLEFKEGDRILEIGCVEIIDRMITKRTFYSTLNPEREVSEGAKQKHGYTWKRLKDSPLFIDIYDELVSFIQGDELVIHNAPFDLGFLDAELKRIQRPTFIKETESNVVDTLEITRAQHRGQANTLDALCDRYGIDRAQRTLHGALLDAALLAQVYLAMTRGQTDMLFSERQHTDASDMTGAAAERLSDEGLVVLAASSAELKRHEEFLAMMKKK